MKDMNIDFKTIDTIYKQRLFGEISDGIMLQAKLETVMIENEKLSKENMELKEKIDELSEQISRYLKQNDVI